MKKKGCKIKNKIQANINVLLMLKLRKSKKKNSKDEAKKGGRKYKRKNGMSVAG